MSPLQLSRPEGQELHALQRELRALGSACGCVAATIALVVTGGAWTYYFVFAHPEQAAGTQTVWTGIGLAFLAAAGGKIVGLLWARYRHSVLSRRLRTLLRIEPVPLPSHSVRGLSARPPAPE